MRHRLYLLITIHPPQFDLTIVGTRNNQREGGVEGSPVHATIMSLQDMLDHRIRHPEQVGLPRGLDSVLDTPRSRGHILLSQSC